MFRNILQQRKGRLARYIATLTPQRTASLCEQNERSEHFVALTVGLIIASTAGHFIRDDVPRLKIVLRGVNKDVIAFEALAFSAFTVREYFEPIETGIWDETVTEAFKDGFAFCRSIVQRELGNDHSDVFERRLMTYAAAHSRGGMREAAGTFCGVLQSIGTTSEPSGNYGPPALNLIGALEMVGVVYAFTATMPKTAADSLHAIGDHFGFF